MGFLWQNSNATATAHIIFSLLLSNVVHIDVQHLFLSMLDVMGRAVSSFSEHSAFMFADDSMHPVALVGNAICAACMLPCTLICVQLCLAVHVSIAFCNHCVATLPLLPLLHDGHLSSILAAFTCICFFLWLLADQPRPIYIYKHDRAGPCYRRLCASITQNVRGKIRTTADDTKRKLDRASSSAASLLSHKRPTTCTVTMANQPAPTAQGDASQTNVEGLEATVVSVNALRLRTTHASKC